MLDWTGYVETKLCKLCVWVREAGKKRGGRKEVREGGREGGYDTTVRKTMQTTCELNVTLISAVVIINNIMYSFGYIEERTL